MWDGIVVLQIITIINLAVDITVDVSLNTVRKKY